MYSHLNKAHIKDRVNQRPYHETRGSMTIGSQTIYDGLKNDLPSCLNKAILPTIGPSIPHPNPIRKRPTKIIIRLAPNAIVIEPVIENNIAVMIGNFTDFNLSHKCLKIK